MVLGDFNAHYPNWSGINGHEINTAGRLLHIIIQKLKLTQILPAGIITRVATIESTRNSIIDLIFTNGKADFCGITTTTQPQLNYHPILVLLDIIPAPKTQTIILPNWEKTDKIKFRELLNINPPSANEINNAQKLENAVHKIMQHI